MARIAPGLAAIVMLLATALPAGAASRDRVGNHCVSHQDGAWSCTYTKHQSACTTGGCFDVRTTCRTGSNRARRCTVTRTVESTKAGGPPEPASRRHGGTYDGGPGDPIIRPLDVVDEAPVPAF